LKAVKLHAYREPLTVDEVAEPEATGPRGGDAGVGPDVPNRLAHP
jgi:hypothetical protein